MPRPLLVGAFLRIMAPSNQGANHDHDQQLHDAKQRHTESDTANPTAARPTSEGSSANAPPTWTLWFLRSVGKMWAKLIDCRSRAFAGIVCAVGGAGRTPIPEAASGIAHETPDCCRAARQTWRVRAMAELFGFMPDAPPFSSSRSWCR